VCREGGSSDGTEAMLYRRWGKENKTKPDPPEAALQGQPSNHPKGLALQSAGTER